jgi:2-dehydro-3-deoxyphosphogluconate aldolase/(4S)-4-hydroxy-2-oxoglutarate aldolase
MNEVLEKIGELGLVPVVAIERSEDAISLGKALINGDLPIAEITFRTAAAQHVIETITRELPGLLVGAGTVLTVEQVRRAVTRGAKFIVSPGFNPKVVDYCVENGIPVIPGLNTPTELEMALERGLEVVKFFPAEPSGGVGFLKAMAAPYRGIRFVPTGGITKDNLISYLSYERVHACGGSWMVKADLISSGQFDEITRLTREAVSTMLGFEFRQLGINEESAERALDTAKTLSKLFYFPVEEGTRSIFVGSGFQVTKSRFPGERGQIVITTNDILRAIAYLKAKGVLIREETKEEKNGKLSGVYLEAEVSGFAIRLLQK